MRKKSIITIMLLITISTTMIVSCNSKDKNKEEIKVETSIDNNKKDSEKIAIKSEEKKKIKEQNNIKEEKSKAKKINKEDNENKNSNKTKEEKQKENLNFSPQKAIEIAKQKYGTQKGNILYSYREEPCISENKKGYYIKLSSKTMIEQGGTGTLTWLLVTEDGKIIEGPKMN